jgi:hypothetical protein
MMCYDWLRRSVVGTVFLDKSYDGLGRDYNYYVLPLSLCHPSHAAEASSDPTTLPTSSSHAGDIILTTKGLQDFTLEHPTRYAACTRSHAVTPTVSGLSTLSCSHHGRL